MRRASVIVLCATLLAACSARIGDFTLTSTKNLGYAYTPLRSNVRGEDCAHMILFIPVGSLNPTIDQALDNAVLEVPGGDMMTNVSIHQDMLFLYFYNRFCMRVDGDVVNSRQGERGEQSQ